MHFEVYRHSLTESKRQKKNDLTVKNFQFKPYYSILLVPATANVCLYFHY